MAIVGAFARIEGDWRGTVRSGLDALPGVSTFSLPDPGIVGILIESSDLSSAHARLTEDIRRTPGILGVWPVYVSTEDEEPEEYPRTRAGTAVPVPGTHDRGIA